MESIASIKNLLKTPLYEWHQQHNAQIAPFGSYLLPLWYEKGAKAEHLGVIQSAGLFDTSHMAEVLVSGPDAFDVLQWCFSRDLSSCFGKERTPLPTARGVYGVFLDDRGHLIDDAIVYRLDPNAFFVCVNAGKGKVIAEHLRSATAMKKFSARDLTGEIAKIDLQGPESARILNQVLEPGNIFETFAPFSIKGLIEPPGKINSQVRTTTGIALMIARSGYTGEFGFELFAKAQHARELWEVLIAKGEDFNLIPCGLAARDSLRTGAGLPLAGHDIGHWPFVNNPWLFALPYGKDKNSFTKPFLGREALEHAQKSSYTYPFAGFDLRKIDTAHATVWDGGQEIGTVLTCVTDMAIDRFNNKIIGIRSPKLPKDYTVKGLCCGFIKTATPLNLGTTVELKDSHRSIAVEIVADIRPDRSARLPLKNFL